MELYVQKLELICKRRDVVYTYNIINAKIVLYEVNIWIVYWI